jgi:hypothetical protein
VEDAGVLHERQIDHIQTWVGEAEDGAVRVGFVPVDQSSLNSLKFRRDQGFAALPGFVGPLDGPKNARETALLVTDQQKRRASVLQETVVQTVRGPTGSALIVRGIEVDHGHACFRSPIRRILATIAFN